MTDQKLPEVYVYCEGGEGCGCQTKPDGGVQKLDVRMKIVDGDILVVDLFEYNAMPRLGDASDIQAVRVHVRNKEVMVYAIYSDPKKTALNSCCTGSGCTCYASGCMC